MDMHSWVDLLFAYGPYAVLVLFALWIAPRQAKLFREIPTENTAQYYFSGVVAAVCWLIVFAMVWYIYVNWSPRKVYFGSLGTHEEGVVLVSTDDDLFISSRAVSTHINKLRWKFVVISDSGHVQKQRRYAFSYFYKNNETNYYKDYFILGKDLQARRIELVGNKSDPESLYMKSGSGLVRYPHFARYNEIRSKLAAELSISARAQTGIEERDRALIEALVSQNPHFRAHARKILRESSVDELRRLLTRPDLPLDARREIDANLRKKISR